MSRIRAVRVFVLVSLILAGIAPGRALAQAAAPADQLREAQAEVERLKKELDAMRAQYDARLTALEEKLTVLAAAPSAPAEAAPAPPVASSAPAPGSSKVFNPDIAVIGNFVGVAGKNPNSTQPTLNLSEVETSLQAVVDPYARADFYLSAGPEGLNIEEGFATFNTLPGGLLLKVGKMRAQFGKINTLHTHALTTTDRPLVTQNLVGGEEGISESGLSLSKLISSSALFVDVTGEAYYGNSEVFHSHRAVEARLRGPRARVSRPHRGHQSRRGRVVRLRTVRRRPAGDANRRRPVDAPRRLRRDLPLSAAETRHLQALHGAHGARVEPAAA